jgi:hypothetical protein
MLWVKFPKAENRPEFGGTSLPCFITLEPSTLMG